MAGTAARHRVAILNLNETRRDPRVQRIAGTLQRAGHTVQVFEMRLGESARDEVVNGLPIRRVNVPMEYGPEAMAQLRRSSAAAARVIEECEPAVMSFEDGSRRIGMAVAAAKEELHRARCRLRGLRAPRRVIRDEIMAIRSIMLINLELLHEAEAFRPTLVIANDLDTLLAAFMLRDRLGIDIIYDAHEVYPEQLPDDMRSQLWNRFYTAFEGKLAPAARGTMTVCDSIGRYFDETYGVKGMVTILNVPSRHLLPDESILERPRNAPRRILYHGAYFKDRGLEEVIAASPLVENAVFEFRGIGGHEVELRRLVSGLRAEDRVHFRDPVPIAELVPQAAACDIGLNPFVKSCKNMEFALPNKFFEYMMAGLAIVSSNLVELRNLTERLQVGRLLDGLRPREIASSLNALLADADALDACRRNAYEAARTRFNWESEEARFLEFFDEVAR